MKLGKMKKKNTKKFPDTFGKNSNIRDAYFEKFAQTHFHISPYCKNRAELTDMANNYSAFLVGSDQLWRTDSVEHGYYTLEWVPDNIRKIAYSTSIGVKKFLGFRLIRINDS